MPLHPGYGQPYQVGPQDRDLLQLAERLGTDFPTLSGMNPSITSISTGQYINIPGVPPVPGTTPPNPGIPGVPPGVQTTPSASPTLSAANQYGAPIGPVMPNLQPNAGQLLGQQYANQYNNLSPSESGSGTIRGPHTATPENALRLTFMKQNLLSATDPSEFPPTMSATDAGMMGFSPSQMTQAGYVLKNGTWSLPSAGGAPGAAGAPAAGPQTANNWMTNPSLHLVKFNARAKNKKNRFVTTEKWARNAWKRKLRPQQRTEPAAEVRPDTPSTTLDLVLGS